MSRRPPFLVVAALSRECTVTVQPKCVCLGANSTNFCWVVNEKHCNWWSIGCTIPAKYFPCENIALDILAWAQTMESFDGGVLVFVVAGCGHRRVACCTNTPRSRRHRTKEERG